MALSLGDPNFVSTSALRAYCENGRGLIRPLGPELHMAAIELRAALKEVPVHEGNAWVKARIVSSHLNAAAKGAEATVKGLVRTYLSFERHFINETPRTSKTYFDLGK